MFLKIPKNRQKLSGFCLFFVSLGSRTLAGGFPGSCLGSRTPAAEFLSEKGGCAKTMTTDYSS